MWHKNSTVTKTSAVASRSHLQWCSRVRYQVIARLLIEVIQSLTVHVVWLVLLSIVTASLSCTVCNISTRSRITRYRMTLKRVKCNKTLGGIQDEDGHRSMIGDILDFGPRESRAFELPKWPSKVIQGHRRDVVRQRTCDFCDSSAMHRCIVYTQSLSL